jgi:ATP-dependent Lon protease
MRDYRDAKPMAQSLRKALAANGITQTHSQCLELIAHAFGLDNWNTLLAKIEPEQPDSPTLSAGQVVTSAHQQRVLRMSAEEAQPSQVYSMPVIPMRNLVILPGMTVPLFVGRPKSVRAVERALSADQRMFVVAQKSAEDDAPTAADLQVVGVIAEIVQCLKLEDGTLKVLVKAGRRARLTQLNDGEVLEAQIETFEAPVADEAVQTLAREALEQFWRSANLDPSDPPLALKHLRQIPEHQPSALSDQIGPLVVTRLDQAQALLEITDPAERLKKLIALMSVERKAA